MEFVQPIRDPEKLTAMKKVLKGSNLRDYTMFTIGINSALRISDILKLKVSDVLDDKGKVADRITNIRETKTKKAKDFPISSNAKKAIEEYLKARKDLKVTDYLFVSRKGQKAITRQQAWHIINQAAGEVGINDKIGSHSLRKTFAYHAYKSGYDLSIIQKLLNHSSPKETLRYIGITQDQMDDVYINLNL